MLQHPQILAPSVKEVHFFDLKFASGEGWYRQHFPLSMELARKRAITIEASPYYIFHPHALKRVKAVLPSAKIILLLRDPADRAISHYFHEVRLGQEELPLPDALALEEDRLAGELARMLADEAYYSFAHQHYTYKGRGQYLEQIEQAFQLFGREQVHIIRSELMFASPRLVLDEIFAFLGLSPYTPAEYVRQGRPGAYRKEEVPGEVRSRLKDYFAPYNQRLYHFLNKEFDW
jgi:hypothetical protein